MFCTFYFLQSLQRTTELLMHIMPRGGTFIYIYKVGILQDLMHAIVISDVHIIL